LLPLCENYKGQVKNLLRTLCEHAAFQVNRAVSPEKPSDILVTGGGAHNVFLMECIRQYGKHKWTISTAELSDFKEALVFAFLGVLRWRGEINVLSSVTGCIKDHMGGTIYLAS
jgi:anhydro-N-acetylmuramic acid kinase